MNNLLKVMNQQKYLDNLKTINEVYDNKLNIIEEVLIYHQNKSQGNYLFSSQEETQENDQYSKVSEGTEDDESKEENSYLRSHSYSKSSNEEEGGEISRNVKFNLDNDKEKIKSYSREGSESD
jgi:hypothetical protein